MMVIPKRSVEWVERWSKRGLGLGRHDGAGNPIFEYDPSDMVASKMVADLKADSIMQHGVVLIILEMVRACARDGAWSDA